LSRHKTLYRDANTTFTATLPLLYLYAEQYLRYAAIFRGRSLLWRGFTRAPLIRDSARCAAAAVSPRAYTTACLLPAPVCILAGGGLRGRRCCAVDMGGAFVCYIAVKPAYLTLPPATRSASPPIALPGVTAGPACQNAAKRRCLPTPRKHAYRRARALGRAVADTDGQAGEHRKWLPRRPHSTVVTSPARAKFLLSSAFVYLETLRHGR